MTSLAARRKRSLLVFLILAGVLAYFVLNFSSQLMRTAVPTGWILLASILFLAGYQLRKKIPLAFLGSASTWLQFHIYVGLFTAVLFALHTGLKWPGNMFNVVLAATYLLLFSSGIIGLLFTRLLPRRLTSSGEEVLFERIPTMRRQIRLEVEKLISDQSESTVFREIYEKHLEEFFQSTSNAMWHFLQSSQPRKKMINALKHHERILNDEEKETLDQIIENVIQKDHLDYSWTIQATLKLWLFVHVPLTYGLITLVIFHVIVVSAFYGVSW